MSAVATEAGRLIRVFELERDRGFDNQAVVGGLDRMLIQMVEDGVIRKGTALEARLHALPPGGYRSLGAAERDAWVSGTLVALRREQIAPVQGPNAPLALKRSSTPPTPTPQPTAIRAPSSAGTVRRAAVGAQEATASEAGRLTPGSPVTRLPGVGRAAVARFERLGVTTAGDAVFLFPRRFNDFTDLRKISDLRPGSQPQTVVGTIFTIGEVRFGRRLRGTQAVITDGSGMLKAMWWNMPFVARALSQGQRVVLSGRVREYRGRIQMENPEYEPADDDAFEAGRLQPVYPATQ